MAQESARHNFGRQIDIYSAGCATCRETIQMVEKLAADGSHDVRVHDMHQEHVARHAKELGIRSVPAVVVVDPGHHAAPGQFAPVGASKLAACCSGRGPEEAVIREALR